MQWWMQFLHPGQLRTPGGGYWFWSGIGSGSPLFAVSVAYALAFWRRHNCHADRCPRLIWHTHAGHGHPVCKLHHPHGGNRPHTIGGTPHEELR